MASKTKNCNINLIIGVMKKFAFYCPLLILLSFFTSCEDSLKDNDSFWQVYEEWEDKMYVGSGNVVGEPSIPLIVLKGGSLPGATLSDSNMPWTIQGSITSGILSIDFPEILNFSDKYSSEHTCGIKIARVYIKDENHSSQSIGLHKLGEQNSGVIIYYIDKDFECNTGDGSEIQLKAGWNFWDRKNNIISQDINDFLNKDYRWRWESWN